MMLANYYHILVVQAHRHLLCFLTLPYLFYQAVTNADLEFRSGVGLERMGLGTAKPGEIGEGDDEFDQYRKRMMLAYRFRPNPMVCP